MRTINDEKLKQFINPKNITFDEENHIYKVNGDVILSVTQELKVGGIAPDYDMVDVDVLEKARLRGNAIHCQVEDWINHNEPADSEEAIQIIDYLKKVLDVDENGNYVDVISEGTIYSQNKIKPFVGRFDILAKIGGEYTLFDIKTNKSWSGAIENYTRWQLSLYAKAIEEMGVKVNSLVILKFDKIKMKTKMDGVYKEFFQLRPVSVNKINEDRINKFLENGYLDKDIICISQNTMELFENLQKAEEEVKILKEQVDNVRKKIYEYMKARDIIKCQTEDGFVKITRIKEYDTTTFDKKQLEMDDPITYGKYVKHSRKEGYIKITWGNKTT